MIYAIISLVLVLLVCFYVIFNLLKKNEKLEDMVVYSDSYIKKFYSLISQSDEKLKLLDDKGSFKSDDEIGFFFNNVKEMQSILNEYISPYAEKS